MFGRTMRKQEPVATFSNPEHYAAQRSAQAKLQRHAELMLKKTLAELRAHINSKSSTDAILTKPSPYLVQEIKSENLQTAECTNSLDFYQKIGIDKPEKFHMELSKQIADCVQQAWAEYSAKNTNNRTGRGFESYVTKPSHLSKFLPKVDANGKRFLPIEEKEEEMVHYIIPPIRPPVMKSEMPALGEFVELQSSLPALKPLQDSLPPLKPIKFEQPISELVPKKLETSMPALKPIEEESPLESSMPILKPLDAEDIAGPKEFFRRKRDEYREKDAAKKERKAKEAEARAEEQRKAAERAAKKAMKGKALIVVKWLGNSAVKLNPEKAYVFLAPSDFIAEKLVERHGDKLDKNMVVENHLAEFDLEGKVNAEFTTLVGQRVVKEGAEIKEPRLANPAILSSCAITVQGAKVLVVEHNNVLPPKNK